MSYRMTIIVPIYNEEDNIERLTKTLQEYLSKSPTKSKVLFVDDGSKDHSFEHIRRVCEGTEDFGFLKFKQMPD